MFLRQKKSGDRVYLQLVENRREDGVVRQRVVATLGRLEELQQSGELDGLARSAAKLSEQVLVLDAHERGTAPAIETMRIGPPLIFERLWRDAGCGTVIRELLSERKFEFDIERAVFLTVLHRLFDPGSDRAADRWKSVYRIDGVNELDLHHLYRAMAWLGEALPSQQQSDRTPFTPRCTKDLIEEMLFDRRRDLFTSLSLVFMDTTSIYFEGNGGETIGQYGHSKDSRPDRRQLILSVVLDHVERPVCSEIWPGNTTDVKSLIPVMDRLRGRFGIRDICTVADRGMFSDQTIRELDERGLFYILGARMRRNKVVRDLVLGRGGRYREVYPERSNSKDPSPLKVKEVEIDGRRYIVCVNEEQRRKDAADRQAIVTSLRETLRRGDKALVGNKVYRKFLAQRGERFTIDEAAVEEDARYDGKWVIFTNTDYDATEVALRYKQLWTVEDVFRAAKTLLETRPIFHKRDETIRGHVFCSFLALLLRWELLQRLDDAHHEFEWDHILRDLDELTETEVHHEGKRFILSSQARGTAGRVFQAAGVALPRTVRNVTGRFDA
jgi:hypothetical protein